MLWGEETERVELTREQIYDLVWSRSLLQLADEFGVTSTALAKRCKRLRIPVPGVGYWAKVQAGHRVPRPKLPKAAKGSPTTALFFRKIRPEPLPPKTPPTFYPIDVPVTLTPTHPLVCLAQESLTETRENGILDHSPLVECPAIYVTKPLLARALRIFEALIRAVESRGWVVAHDREHRTHVAIDAVRVPIVISERRTTNRTGKLLPNGLLQIEVACRNEGIVRGRAWRDRKSWKLEDVLHDVCRGIWDAAQEIGAWEARRGAWDKAAEARRKAAAAEEEKKKIKAVEAMLEERRAAAARSATPAAPSAATTPVAPTPLAPTPDEKRAEAMRYLEREEQRRQIDAARIAALEARIAQLEGGGNRATEPYREERRRRGEPDMDLTKMTFYALSESQFSELNSKLDKILARLDALENAPRPATSGPEPIYLSLKLAAERFGISKGTLYRLIADPDLGFREAVIRIPPGSGRMRVMVKEFEALLRKKGSGRRRGLRASD